MLSKYQAFIACGCVVVLVLPSLSAAESPPNVLLIVSDDQRPDTIGALGNTLIATPNLDRLVRRGSVFTNAICANPICTPSRAELLTGCNGIRNKAFDFGRKIDPQLPTLPEPFNRAGYKTWYCGKWHNDGRPSNHGYANTHRLFTGGGGKWWTPQNDYRGHPITGYKGWIFRNGEHEPLPELGIGLTPNISKLIGDGAIDMIRDSSDVPFLIHMNFTAPHDPLLLPPGYENRYDPEDIPLPKNFASEHPFDHGNRGGRDELLLPTLRTESIVRADIAAYYAVISHMDAQIGRVLDALDAVGKTESTIIVFASDHGLGMGSHGIRGKQNMYEHTILVPLVFAGPGVPEGKRYSGHAYLRDIFPTVCDLSGLEIPAVDGKSQLPVLKGNQESMYEFTIGYFRDSQRMIRTHDWKLIEYPLAHVTQLFNIQSDPNELSNLAGDPRHAQTQQQLASKLAQWLLQANR